ncbi:MFS transporter [Salinicola avicenniae]|uniref:MFS transporter n=1 Tax=Salinicola avicenniae TaxID=2916836 RepID=UPI0020735EF3|nr:MULTISPECIES: MFS transporter [unclassified Salinicola]
MRDAASPHDADASQRRRAIVATVIGNGLEWFDYTVYSFFAAIIATQFFPSDDEMTSLLLALGTFGVGFVIRPFGGILLGIYADRVGRRPALMLTIMLMAGATLLIGIAPTYEQIGVWAPILIVIARLAQGLAAGGEMGSAAAFLTEHAPLKRKAFYASWIQSSIGVAILLGAASGTLLSLAMSTESLHAWGWRMPFILGALAGPLGFYIRRRLKEPGVLKADERSHSPLAEIVRRYPRETLVSFSLVALWTVCSYAILFYLPSYSQRFLELPERVGFAGGMLGGCVLALCTPIAGHLADRTGRRPWLIGSSLAILVLIYPMFAMINHFPGLGSLLLCELILGIAISGYTGVVVVTFSEILPPRVLSTGLSIAYNLAVMLFGGFAGFIITWLIDVTGNPMAPAFYVMFAAAVSLAGSTLVREPEHLRKGAMLTEATAN